MYDGETIPGSHLGLIAQYADSMFMKHYDCAVDSGGHPLFVCTREIDRHNDQLTCYRLLIADTRDRVWFFNATVIEEMATAKPILGKCDYRVIFPPEEK